MVKNKTKFIKFRKNLKNTKFKIHQNKNIQ